MKVEWYAVVVVAIGVGLWISGSVLDSMIAMLCFTLFGGGAALIIGRATIQPVSLALIFVVGHLLLSMFRRSDHANVGLKTNGYLALFCFYGAFSALLLPRIFARTMTVEPLSTAGLRDFYLSTPLRYTSQNLTTAVYLLGTLVASVCAGAAAVDPKSRRRIVIWGAIISWTHIAFGLAGLFLPAGFIKVFRNATYAELEQTAGGFARISGVFPEPSAYASYAFSWMVFMAELWLRDVSPRLTLITAAALAVMLVACTSSAGYAAIAVYAIVMLGRFFVAPQSLGVTKAIPVAMIILTLLSAVLALFAFDSHLAGAAARVLDQLTVGKSETVSGRQRLYAIATGFKAVQVTGGLGIGAGSFRSSSLLIAILGGMGILGFLAFAGHFLNILKPLKRATYALPGDPAEAVGVAAAWGACAGLIPAMLAAPTPDPSFLFALMGGLALGWRYRAPSGAPVPVFPQRPLLRTRDTSAYMGGEP